MGGKRESRESGNKRDIPYPTLHPTMADKKSQGKRSALHILVAVRELGIRIGGPTSVRREAIVDVGNAHDFADAENKAKVRAARQWHTNVICVQVTEVNAKVRPTYAFHLATVDEV